MAEIEEVVAEIEDLRKRLNELIKEKKDLLDPQVIVASQMLDAILNEYNKVVSEKKK